MKSNPLFRFLASLRLAVALLLALAAVMAAGTVIESRTSAAVAKNAVYGTPWFALLLILLVVNVLSSALSRWPWKRYHTGFVVTHLGIILILLGSLLTQLNGLDGQMALAEGEVGATVTGTAPFVYFTWGDSEPQKIPARRAFGPPAPNHPILAPLSGGATLSLTGYVENGRKEFKAGPPRPGQKGTPAIHFRLKGSMADQDAWLILGDPDHSRLDLGPARIVFAEAKEAAKLKPSLGRNGLLVSRDARGSLTLESKFQGAWRPPVKDLQAGRGTPTGWMDMELTLLEKRDSAVSTFDFIPQPYERGADPLPAVRYRFSAPEGATEGWVEWRGHTEALLGGKALQIAFEPDRTHLPFAIRLEKFDIGFDPGTQRPSSYASRVKLVDPEKGVDESVTISMNQPLHYRGNTFFQASYSQMEGGGYASVFSVARDPGIALKYGGSLVLVIGILLMYLFRKTPVPGGAP